MHSIDGSHIETFFCHRNQEHWLFGISQSQLQQRVKKYLEDLNHCPPGRILILLSDPLDFLATYIACVISNRPIFLGNPAWQHQELTQAKAIARPTLIWTDSGLEQDAPCNTNENESGWIMIPTGGTSGQIKFTIHTWETLSAAVSGMQSFFFEGDKPTINSYCVLPLYHVSGLMQFMRSLLTGGQFATISYKTILQSPHIAFDLAPNHHFFLSLVPTQLSRLLTKGTPETMAWLAQFRCILLGGAPSPPSLLQQARQYQLPVAPTYGMTETGAQVMTLKPEKFLAGEQIPHEILPHVSLNLVSQNLGAGQMQWTGPSICYGYYPDFDTSQIFLTDDIAHRTSQGQIVIKGRASRKIISGGENIYPEEIEAIVIAMKEIDDICVFGMPDTDWGEIAIAAYVTSHQHLSDDALSQTLKTSLASYKCPKVWWRSPEIPRNPQGKVKLQQLKEQYSSSICKAHSINSKFYD